MEEFARKITSRKFLLALAAFLASIAAGLAGIADPEVCAVCAAVSAGIYAACEAYVDGKSAEANGTRVLVNESTARTVTATSADKATVVAAFNAGREE